MTDKEFVMKKIPTVRWISLRAIPDYMFREEKLLYSAWFLYRSCPQYNVYQLAFEQNSESEMWAMAKKTILYREHIEWFIERQIKKSLK